MKRDCNALVQELDSKYFPEERWGENSSNIRKIHAKCELFNNGCITLSQLTESLMIITKEDEEVIIDIILKHYEF